MKKTALFDTHVKLGAKMVPFAGYEMPIQYKPGIIQEHAQVREKVGLFDVSHMGQIKVVGAGAGAFFAKITPSDFVALPVGVSKYTVMLNEEGGIIDDLIVTRFADDVYGAVINAACKEKDLAWIKQHLPEDVELEILDDRALIAVQGPMAEKACDPLVKADLSQLDYMRVVETETKCGIPVVVSRTGYTGEDGFEVSVSNDEAATIWNRLMEQDNVGPAGLGARDILRVEMGYHLYGHDMSDKTLPLEVGLGWVMTKGHSGYIGEDAIEAMRADGGANKKRVALKLDGKMAAREGSEVYVNDERVGEVTSGAFSPIVGSAIAHASIEKDAGKVGDVVDVQIRNKRFSAEIVKFPFIPAKTK